VGGRDTHHSIGGRSEHRRLATAAVLIAVDAVARSSATLGRSAVRDGARRILDWHPPPPPPTLRRCSSSARTRSPTQTRRRNPTRAEKPVSTKRRTLLSQIPRVHDPSPQRPPQEPCCHLPSTVTGRFFGSKCERANKRHKLQVIQFSEKVLLVCNGTPPAANYERPKPTCPRAKATIGTATTPYIDPPADLGADGITMSSSRKHWPLNCEYRSQAFGPTAKQN